MLADVATTHERSRKPVRDACIRFPDERREYPEEFVRALAGSGPYLVFSYLAGHVFPGPL